MCIDISVLHRKDNAFIRGQVAVFLSLTCRGVGKGDAPVLTLKSL